MQKLEEALQQKDTKIAELERQLIQLRTLLTRLSETLDEATP